MTNLGDSHELVNVLSLVPPLPQVEVRPLDIHGVRDRLLAANAESGTPFVCRIGEHGESPAWYQWNGAVWEPRCETVVDSWIRSVIADAREDAIHLSTATPEGGGKSPAARHLAAVDRLLDRPVKSIREEVSTKLTAVVPVLNVNPHRLVTPAGVVSLATGELTPHRKPEHVPPRDGVFLTHHLKHDPATAVAPALKGTELPYPEYYADFPERVWGDWLRWFTCGDESLAEYLQVAVGAALSGDSKGGQLVHIFKGNGGNGKSVLFDHLQATLAPYSAIVPSTLFATKKQGRPPSASQYLPGGLPGRRLLLGPELPQGAEWDIETLKMWSGKEGFVGREIGKAAGTISVEWRIFLSANKFPAAEADNTAFWRRIRVVPCFAVYNAEDPNDPRNGPFGTELETWLATEESKQETLRWAIEGARKWYAGNYQMPACPAVDLATQRYRDEQDTGGDLLSGCFEATGNEADYVAAADILDVVRGQYAATNTSTAACKITIRSNTYVTCRDSIVATAEKGGVASPFRREPRTATPRRLLVHGVRWTVAGMHARDDGRRLLDGGYND